MPLLGRDLDPEARRVTALRVGRYSLIGLGILAFVLSLLQHHYKDFSVAIFAQEGVYALLAATFVPVLFGTFDWELPKEAVVIASLVALAVHFTFRYGHLTILSDNDWTNPGLTATYALLASAAVPLVWRVFNRRSAASSALNPTVM